MSDTDPRQVWTCLGPGVVVRVARVGPMAARFLAGRHAASLAAVFERSLYIEAGGAFVCLGAPGIGDGPINAVLGEGASTVWIEAARAGQPVVVRGGSIDAGAWQADASQARLWQPQPWPLRASSDAMRSALARVEEIAAAAMPADGLAPLVLHTGKDAPATSFARIAAPRVAKLQRWLGCPHASPPPLDLLGLGPGLTPSGDDALCGALIALDALGADATRDALAAAVMAQAPAATTPLSAHFLAAAAEGLGSAALHDVVAALVRADLDRLPATIAALARIGHTSGWDALAGVVLVLRAAMAVSGTP